ncbi:MAG: hypothetical protein R3B70_28275 [Polyangiaceae bacterium]
MNALKVCGMLAALPILALSACTADSNNAPLGDAVTAPAASDSNAWLEQKLHLIPQVLTAQDITARGRTLDGDTARYLLLSGEAGDVDLQAIRVSGETGESLALPELLDLPEHVRNSVSDRDALLLLSVPADQVDALCERFQTAHVASATVRGEDDKLLFVSDAGEDRVHALCLLPALTEVGEGADQTQAKVASSGEPSNYGASSTGYVVKIATLKCNDPRDWENWPYNGDEARMRAFYDGAGGDQIWSANDVKSGKNYTINRFVHFNNNAKIELYDYDSGLWNASDKLGAEWVYKEEACSGTHYGDFDGSGSGHNWNYDMTYKVYGPSCPCQSQEPAKYVSYLSETCSVTSTTVTSYSYYCSGGIYWRQAWGNRTRHCDTYNKVYNESCEMKTYVSQTLVESCDHFDTGVAIGSPQQWGTCPSDPDPCLPQAQDGTDAADVDQLVAPIECPQL